jgi:hypothetical protein
MYRIRRETGDEVTLGSLEELGTAVAAGIVTAGAEIYHARAEKWLPIASHPHFKMANDRVKAGATQKPMVSRVTASGQRPALGASGQRPAVTAARQPAPQLRVVRNEPTAGSPAAPPAPVPVQGGLAPAAERATPRWSPPQRAVAKAPATKPGVAATDVVPPVIPDLSIVRADALVHDAATTTEPKDMEFELLPVLDEPRVIETESAPAMPAARDDALVITSISDEPVEQSPAAIQLVSHEDKAHETAPQLSTSTGVEIINPDRTMPAMTDSRDVSALEIPAPISDFATGAPAAPPVTRSSSKLPVMIAVAVAVAAAIGFFVLKSGKPAEPAPTTVATAPAAAPANTATTSDQPVAVTATPTPSPVAPPAAKPVTPPSGASAGLGGDAPKKVKKSDNVEAKSATDGLEPPPEAVLPAAPTLGGVTDPSLTTVEAGTASSPVDRAKALEKARHDIDSSMRH